jgi:hypothetical protein
VPGPLPRLEYLQLLMELSPQVLIGKPGIRCTEAARDRLENAEVCFTDVDAAQVTPSSLISPHMCSSSHWWTPRRILRSSTT